MTEASLLASLPGLAFALMLVLCRAGTAVMLLPGLGEAEAPTMVRAGLALALSMLLLPVVAPLVPALPEGASGAAMIGAELLTGAALGWLARLPALALSMAGAIVSYLLGLSSVLQPDPALGGQSAALARLFGLVAPVLILSTGLYSMPLSALAGSYAVVAPGGMLPAGGVTELLIKVAGEALGLALQLSAPFLLAGLVWQVGMGLLARLVPQLQVYTAAAPGQILGGLVLLSLLAARILSAWADSVSGSWAALPGL
ncbi:MAG TPA: flagellar biosynthetic protein FliR [Acetobacteraceae bacterium]|nr:flagellar biosynthetic protein FliR [Acetobacteraceae bacterium]